MNYVIFLFKEINNMSDDFIYVHSYYCALVSEQTINGGICVHTDYQKRKPKWYNLNQRFIDRWDEYEMVLLNVYNYWASKMADFYTDLSIRSFHHPYNKNVIDSIMIKMREAYTEVKEKNDSLNEINEDENVILERVRLPHRVQIL